MEAFLLAGAMIRRALVGGEQWPVPQHSARLQLLDQVSGLQP